MKHIKWKTLIITGVIALLPILIGIFLWDKLPGQIAIHFNLNNEPDGFASKGFDSGFVLHRMRPWNK